MNLSHRRTVLWILFLLACPCATWAQLATTNRAVVLRRDPSKSGPVMAHLPKDSRLTLVDATADSGYFHVKTEHDQVGWVWSKFVTLSAAPSTPSTPPATPTSPTTPSTTPPTTGCDATLASHVYHPHRLIVNQQCLAVTGTIVDASAGREPDGVRHEPDGDTHGWLRPDPEFQNLLNAGNVNNEGGNLVFEIICRFPVTQTDAKAACANYTDRVTLPPVGSHVRIVGTFVQDTFHGQWMEIHPVTSITVLP